MSLIHEKLSGFIKSLAVSFLLSLSISYLLTTNYLDISTFQETILITSVISFLSGLIIHDIKVLLVTVFLSMILALVASTCTLAFSIFVPLIKVEETSYLLTIYFTAMSLIEKTFITMFFFIFPSSLLFSIIGYFLAESLT